MKSIFVAMSLVTFIGSFILVGLTAFSVSSSASASGDIKPPFDDTQLGISGHISNILTEKLIDTEDETVFIASSRGLYILKQETLQACIPLSSQITDMATIEDISGDGKREIVITLYESHYSNVRCYDPATGDLLWQYSSTERVYVEDIGWNTVNSIPSTLKIINNNRIAFTLRDKLLVLDSNGCLAGYANTGLDYLEVVQDMNGDGVSDLLGAMQHPPPETAYKNLQGQQIFPALYLFSGTNGMQIDCIQKTPNVETPTNASFLSMEVFEMDGRSTAAMRILYGEELRLYLIDLVTKAIDWEIAPFAHRFGEFSRRDIRNAGDINSDGYDDIMELAEKRFVTPWAIEYETTIMIYDGRTQETLWDADLMIPSQLNYINFLSLDNQTVLVATQEIDAGETIFNVFDIVQGELSLSFNISGVDFNPNVFQYNGNSWLYYYDHGLLHISGQGDILWHLPVTPDSIIAARGDFVGDDTDDFLLYSNDDVGYLSSVTRSLCVVDGATYQKIWSYNVPDIDSALEHIQIVPDIDGDGRQDIVGIENTGAVRDLAADQSKIFEFSGSGDAGQAKVISEIPLARLTASFAFIPYQAGSYAVGSHSNLSVVDRAGNVLWQKNYTDWGASYTSVEDVSVIVVGDVNDDNIPDIATLFKQEVVISKSDVWPNYIDHVNYRGFVRPGVQASQTETFHYEKEASDLNDDGVKDIVFTIKTDERWVAYTALSPVSGQEVFQAFMGEYTGANRMIVKPSYVDFNNDGFTDNLVFQGEAWGRDSWRWNNLKLWISSGKDGTSIYDIDLSAIPNSISMIGTVEITDTSVMPASAITDMNGDGIAELAVFTMELSVDGDDNTEGFFHLTPLSDVKSRPALTIYDIAQGKELKTFPVIDDDVFKDRKLHISMREIGDVNSNGSSDIALISDIGITVVDVQQERTISKFSLDSPVEIVHVADSQTVGLVIGGGLYMYDASSDFTITSPATGSNISTPARVSWEGGTDGSSTRVLVNQVFAGQTADNYFDLPLKKGSYKLTIASEDQYGKTYYDTVVFTTAKGVATAVFIILLLIILVASLLAFRFSKKIRRAKFKWGGWLRKTP